MKSHFRCLLAITIIFQVICNRNYESIITFEENTKLIQANVLFTFTNQNKDDFSNDYEESRINLIGSFNIIDTFKPIELDHIIDVRKVNRSCEYTLCSTCQQKEELIFNKSLNQTNFTTKLTCPICQGQGYHLIDTTCEPFYTVSDALHIDLPVGVHPGYKYTISDMGHEVIQGYHSTPTSSLITTPIIKRGKVTFEITHIQTDNYTLLPNSTLSLTLPICATEALYGFNKTINYFDDIRKLSINRYNKTTLPGTTVTLPGYGITYMTNNISTNICDTVNTDNIDYTDKCNENSAVLQYHDLIIKFVLNDNLDECIDSKLLHDTYNNNTTTIHTDNYNSLNIDKYTYNSHIIDTNSEDNSIHDNKHQTININNQDDLTAYILYQSSSLASSSTGHEKGHNSDPSSGSTWEEYLNGYKRRQVFKREKLAREFITLLTSIQTDNNVN